MARVLRRSLELEAAPLPAVDAHWDPLIAVLCLSVLFDIGRLHLLFPILAIAHPALLCFVAAIGLCLMSRKVGRAFRALRHPAVYLMGAMLVWAALSVPGGVYPGASFSFLVGTLARTMVTTLIVAISVRGPRDVKRLLLAFYVAALIYAVIVLVRFRVAPGERLANLYTYDANDLALFIVCTVPFALYLVLRSPWFLRKAAALGALLTLAVVFVWTGSRGGFLALIATLGIVIFTWKFIKLPWRIGAVAAALLVLVFASNRGYWNTMSNMLSPTDDYNLTSVNGRVQVWKRGLGYMWHNPILGVGVNAFPSAEGRLSALAKETPDGKGFKWSAAHNSLIQVGAELGIPGLVLFVAFLFTLFRTAWRLARPKGGSLYVLPPPGATLAGLMVPTLVGFFVAAFFLSQAYGSILYFLAAIVLALHRIAVRNARSARLSGVGV